MSGMSQSAHAYLMGHTDHERRRLTLQGIVLNPITEQFLRRAGIAEGMHVLDIGCGVGEMTMILSRLVGDTGRVTALDIDPVALDRLRERAALEGRANITPIQGDLMAHLPADAYDAVAGRLILIHTKDPEAAVQHAASLVRPGGIVAFQDGYFRQSVAGGSYPESRLLRHVYDAIMRAIESAIPHADVAMRLYHLMLEAGLVDPDCRAECYIVGGCGHPAYEWIAETARTLLPAMERFGIATAAEMDVDTIASRIEEEVVSLGAGFMMPAMFG